MPSTTLQRGNMLYDYLVQPTALTWSTATLATVTTAEYTATLPGINLGDYVDMYLSSAPMTTGLSISNIRVPSANTIAVTWVNSSAGTLTIPTGPYIINVSRPEAPTLLPQTAV